MVWEPVFRSSLQSWFTRMHTWPSCPLVLPRPEVSKGRKEHGAPVVTGDLERLL